MTIEEFLRDPGSTTGYFKTLSDDYRLEILKHGLNEDRFERVISIYLDGIPVMLATSQTSIQDPLFLDILQNAGQIPIGTRLFAANSGIIRTNLQITEIFSDDVAHDVICSELKSIGCVNETLYFRSSDFIYENQKMSLYEYSLPGMVELLRKNT
jgi:chorismate-pyruvate lyase